MAVTEGLEPDASPKGISKILALQGAIFPWFPESARIWHSIWHWRVIAN